MSGFIDGFDIGYRGPLIRKSKSRNIPLMVGSDLDLWLKVMKEVKLGRYTGPYEEIPYQNFIQSPIGLVPKAGNQTRLIFHLSFDFGPNWEDKSLNFHTPDSLCTVKYRDLDYAIKTCLALCPQLFSSGNCVRSSMDMDSKSSIFFAKTDLRSAFRILLILPSQRCYLIMKAKNPLTRKWSYFVEKCLPFGASISCAKFQLFSDSLHCIIERMTGFHFTVTNYLDDYLFITQDDQTCNNMVRAFLNLCEDIGCPVALDKTEWASEMVVFLGLLLDGRSGVVAVPEEKRLKALRLLKWAIGQRTVTIRFIQKITGTLNFLNRVIVPGRAFTKRLYSRLKVKDGQGNPLKQYHHVSLNSEFKKDCQVWQVFLNTSQPNQLCRPFTDLEAFKMAVDVGFYTDASLNENLGFGGVFGNRFIVGRWSSQFIRSQKPSIGYLELFALVAGILTWGENDSLCNTKIIVHCDNESVRHMVNKFAANGAQEMKLLRLLALDGLKYNRRVLVKYVKTSKNTLADALSRMNFSKFWKHAPKTMNQTPDLVNPLIWPIENIWNMQY